MTTDFVAIAGSISVIAVAAMCAATYLHVKGRRNRYIPRAEAVRRATEDAMWGHAGGATAIVLAMWFDWAALFVVAIIFYCIWVVGTIAVQAKKIADLHKSCEICDAGIE